MAFFLIVPSVMIVGIVLIHGAASHFGLKLKYKSLILCALASIAIAFVSIKTSPFLDRMFFVKLATLVVGSSLLIALFNRFLIKREPVVEEKISIVISPAELEELTAPSPEPEPELKSKSLLKLINDEKKIQPVEKKFEPIKKVPKPIAKPSVEKKAPSVEKKFEPIKKVSKPIEKPTVEKKAPSVEKKKPVVEKKVAELVTANEKISAVIDKSKPTKTLAAESKLTDEELEAIDKNLASLDDILDFADTQKSAGNFKLAIFAYQKALERYRSDDYAPFIAIDLSSIYKEQAAYIKAIKVCEDSLALPALVRNSSARSDFEKNLAYLRTVQAVLSKHRLLTTPFSKIPRRLLAEIDADFKKQTVFSAV